jgi:hypothetical protein
MNVTYLTNHMRYVGFNPMDISFIMGQGRGVFPRILPCILAFIHVSNLYDRLNTGFGVSILAMGIPPFRYIYWDFHFRLKFNFL